MGLSSSPSSSSSTPARTRIDANGKLVRVEDGAIADSESSFSSVLRSGNNTVDVFGFKLEWRQLFLVLGILSFMIGLCGVGTVVIALGAYTLWSWLAPARSASSSSSSSSRSWGGGNGSRIKCVKDLPRDPKGG